MIKKIECRGSAYKIGFTHGSLATEEINSSIDFYGLLFQQTAHRSWEQVRDIASTFDIEIKTKWPRFYSEIRGIAEGSKRDILDIVALNVRTEIAFGLFSDGCTSLFWHTPDHEFLGQNWDWHKAQAPNLLYLTIYQDAFPTIKFITEAGIIGKIGLNSAGVGVYLNAIRAAGVDEKRMPVHLGLRSALECRSTKDAIKTLVKGGIASSAHILIADGEGDAVGMEFTSSTFARLPLNNSGRIAHTNHLLTKHEDVIEVVWLKDSPARIKQMESLTAGIQGDVGWKKFSGLFEDEKDFPASICREQIDGSTSATLFNIVMDLKARKAVVRMGRPSEVGEVIELVFE